MCESNSLNEQPLSWQGYVTRMAGHSTSLSASAEAVSAFASFATRVQLDSALRAFLLPSLSNRFLDLCFCYFRGTNSDHPRFIGLLHGALGMDSADRVRGLTANGTDILRWRGDHDYGLFATHVAPQANAVFDRSVKIRWRCGIIPHFALSQQNNRPPESSPAAGR